MATFQLGIVMDPIASIHIQKDSSFAMLLAAQARGGQLFYMTQHTLFLQQGIAFAMAQTLVVKEDPNNWYHLGAPQPIRLSELDIILMRKDPPFDMNYIYSTYLLEQAEAQGVLVANRPSSIRDANEKLFTSWFPQCCPDTLVTSQAELIHQFQQRVGDMIIKPLDGMGGASIFHVTAEDKNRNVIIEVMTRHGTLPVMVQQYLPAIKEGDKRILLINGKPIPYALARIPAQGETRGNLAAGGSAEGRPLTEHDYWICEQVGPTLRDKGLYFVGLDVIGEALTEINVTSPTCIRELENQFQIPIADQFIEQLLLQL